VHQTQQPPVGVPWQQATFTASFSRFWRGYLVFRGRAARAEFWWWALWWAIISAAINIAYGVGLFMTRPSMPNPDETRVLDQAMQSFNPFPVWWFLLTSMPVFAKVALGVFVVVGLAALLPWIAIAVRRLHDTNRSGWWVLLYLVPAGNIALAVFLALPSEPPAAPQQSGPPVADRPARTAPAPQ
jgi:uncharacterized membrane protein YhaH (DUF805 family)